MTTIGFIGSGKIGSQLARQAVTAGYDVVLSNSRGPETLADLVAELGPKARAATGAEAAQAADIAVVTIPFKSVETIPAQWLAGKVVIDTNNYYFERDGRIPAIDDGTLTSSELVQQHFATSHVVKAFNHIFSAAITAEAQPAGSADRRALGIFGDDEGAKAAVARLQDDIGFDTVDGGPLSESWRVQRDTPVYGPRFSADEYRAKLAETTR